MLFGSAGFKILASKDAKKVYTQTTAAVLRMKDCTMETVSRVRKRLATFWQMQRPSTKPAQPQLNRKLSLMTLLKAPQNNCFFWAACRRPFFMWWGTAAERMMPLSLCQNWQLGKLNKEIQL